jgi:hypothetical protein
VFQAYLTTFLVDPGFEKSITSTDEIFTSGIKYGFAPIMFDRNFDDKTDPKSTQILKNRIDCNNLVSCILWTAKFRNISYLCTSSFVEYLYRSSEYSDELKGYKFCPLKDTTVLVTDLLMTVQKGSPFLDRVNEIIGRLVESGIAVYLNKFSPEDKTIKGIKPNMSKSLLDEYSALNMNNMQPAFYLLLFGYSLGLISLVLEILSFKISVYLQQH